MPRRDKTAAVKINPKAVADRAVRPVCGKEPGALHSFGGAIAAALQSGFNAVATTGATNKPGAAPDFSACGFERLIEQSLRCGLGQGQHEAVLVQEFFKPHFANHLLMLPESASTDGQSECQHFFGNARLFQYLQRPGIDGQRFRINGRFFRLVDDSGGYSRPVQKQRRSQPDGAGANDERVWFH
jgi:hypothetical protein